jgi:hypothetical protein
MNTEVIHRILQIIIKIQLCRSYHSNWPENKEKKKQYDSVSLSSLFKILFSLIFKIIFCHYVLKEIENKY